MVDGSVPKLVQYLPGILVLVLTVGGILFGWARNRRAPKGSQGTPLDGWLGEDNPHHLGGANHGDHGGGDHGA